MRTLDEPVKAQVQKVIDQHLPILRALPDFVSAEPGFPVVDGSVLREPAIIIFVAHKRPLDSLLPEDLAPRQLGQFRVSVMQASPLRQLEAQLDADKSALNALTVSPDRLTYKKPRGNPVDVEFLVAKPFLCHVGPDAGWPVLKPFLEEAKRTLSVAMYDFNADYISKTFVECIRDKRIKTALTWDNGMTAPETVIRKQLRKLQELGLDAGIVQCGADRRFANAYHEKVAVRDSSSFWLSSGNWSTRSQPNIDPRAEPKEAKGMYSKGNREWHIIVDDKPLAKLFERYIKMDLAGCHEETRDGDPGAALSEPGALLAMPDVLVPIESMFDPELAAEPVTPVAPRLVPSKKREIKVRPLLTPDNYVGHITSLLKSAKSAVYLQFAYITYSAKKDDAEFTAMLKTLSELSWRPEVDVRIIVGSSGAADKIRALAEAGFNDKVFRTQGNVHNKGIVVDHKTVLISSANWSADGVLRNRDAGILVYDREVAAYYSDVFLHDWDNRASSTISDDPPVRHALEGEPTPAGMARVSWSEYNS